MVSLGEDRWSISNPNYRLWRTDTKAIVGGVLLAVCFSITMQLTERLDTALSGGVLYWFGDLFVFLWFPASVINFGLLGGLLTANFNPIVSLLTGASPMAPRFFLDNTMYVIPMSLFCQYYFRRGDGRMNFKQFFLMCVVAEFCNTFSYMITWVYFFKFTVPVMAGLWFLLMLTSIPGSFMGFAFARAVQRSGVADV
ncbi:MAG: hypothetical protein NUW23_14540 [Firmicutes bacterium]|jgi:hypothetical protein|nr:hypothetical protein [Bacillota bacterium]